MKGGSNTGGFTIVETLIVLAISGSMLMSVIFSISGQQARSQFQTSINTIAQQIQQVIGDVSNGFYSTNNISCSAVAGAPSITNGGQGQGTSNDCVLVGKVVQFYSKSDPQLMKVYSLVGLTQSVSTSSVIAIAPGTNTYTSVPDKTTSFNLNGGLSLYYASDNSSLATPETVAFAVKSVNALNGGNTGVTPDVSGAQQLGLYRVNGTSATTTNNIDTIDQYGNYSQVTKFSICLASGTTNQSGLITIGGGTSRKLSAVLTIKSGKVC